MAAAAPPAMRSPDPETRAARPGDWIAALRAYLLATAFLDLLWEAAHLPLYTIWTDGTIRDKAFAVLHCTMGDVDRVRHYPIDAVMHSRRVGHAVTDGSVAAYSSVSRASIGRIVENNPPIGFDQE